VDRANFAVLQSSDLSDTLCLRSSPSVCASEFRNKFPFEVHDIFLSLIAPIVDSYSFFASSTYVILDAQTVYDGFTCLLVTDVGGEMESRRAEFPVALLSAVAAEMGMVGLGSGIGGAGLDDGEILTVQMMDEERNEWEEEKRADNERERSEDDQSETDTKMDEN